MIEPFEEYMCIKDLARMCNSIKV
ncbi:hypothetical protein F383_37943 [Gossypium arboreum]|uniref:Uncharacterized protein n=1 Tax=Gossypium arboreum TaxID=29729 RepID=A0A0B0MGJ7_GOSAR|nr:hypothetical protein F383_37943 [Gossypium arboreum]